MFSVGDGVGSLMSVLVLVVTVAIDIAAVVTSTGHRSDVGVR